MPQQDSFSIFQNPVDSTRVAAQDITSEQVTNLLNFDESLGALWNLIHLEYIFFVIITYYIIVTRVRVIKTNSAGRRNLLLFTLTLIWGLIGYFWRGIPALNLLVTGLCVNAFYEFIFKGVFKALEKFGITPLPEWHVDEIRVEKKADIVTAEKSQTPKP